MHGLEGMKHRTVLFTKNKNHHKFKCFQVNFSVHGLEAQAKPHKTQVQFHEALHAGLKSHRSQRKLIDTHCKTVAVVVSYDSILHVRELCGHSLQRVFGQHNSSLH